jgi:MarR family transcriptional regulator, protease production regulatory protein HPr
MRNTYIPLTEKREELLLTTFKAYEPLQNTVFKEALPLQLYGKFLILLNDDPCS